MKIQFVSPERGWVIPHGGTIHGTADGGKTWTPEPLGHDPTNRLADLHFADERVGHVLCEGEKAEVRRTTDGGATWTSLGKLDTPGHARGVSFPSRGRGWVVGDRGYIAEYREE